MNGITLGYGICGSFCTHAKSLEVLKTLVNCDRYNIIPVLSETVCAIDTRFGKAAEFKEMVEAICQNRAVCTIRDAEPFGPARPLDVLVISPCTGNTLAKIASGITDTSVTMAAKAHLRCDRPLVIALASNDAMSANLKNIGTLLSRKNIYFVPLVQDDIRSKPHSLVADFSRVEETVTAALVGKQVRPLFLTKD